MKAAVRSKYGLRGDLSIKDLEGVEACKENYGLLLNYYHICETSGKELFNTSLERRAYKAIENDFNTVYLPVSEFEKLVDEGNYIDKDDPALFSRLFDDILYYQTTLSNVINIVSKQKSAADSLLQLIKSKYHITD
jgi:hypothetical protein